jgi:acetoin utilization deacetylase AcuC-like enzyme
MNKVGYVYHPDFLKHRPEDYHPENPQRLKSIEAALNESGLKNDLVLIEPEHSTKKDILLNHSENFYKQVQDSSKHDFGNFDPDTYYCKDTFKTALLAAGACLKAGRMVMEGEINSAFCAIRPPGHHAEFDHAKGFCIFNNVAILARWLMKEYNLKRVAILDWDGHHGNGTQHSFYDTDTVHYCSLHAYPFYPGTGGAGETGEGKGEGYTLNFPLFAGAGDDQFVGAVRGEWLIEMDDYKPEIILVSTGYDAFRDDPYVFLDVSPEGINEVCRVAKQAAQMYCGGKIIMVLEGGYVLDYIGKAVVDHIKILVE